MDNNQNDLNVLIKRRKDELTELRSRGIETFAYEFDITSNSKKIKDEFVDDEKKEVKIAGRIMALRKMGKASFAHIQDEFGRIQIYLRKDDIKEQYTAFKLMDIGDIIGVEGYTFKTKTGEISVHVTNLTLLTKSLRPLPISKETVDEEGNIVIHDQFADIELRYRQRYVDLIVNPEVRDVFVLRSKITSAMRRFLEDNGYLEVETPILQPLYGGAAAKPFVTHHNALDTELYLRIADELYLKRLIVGGFNGVFEISKDFRNEGMDKTHNPEFTMMELYVPFKDYNWMMSFVEKMILNICENVFGKTKFNYDGMNIDFAPKWKRVSMIEAIEQKTGVNVLNADEKTLKDTAKKLGCDISEINGKAKLIDEIFSIAIQPELIEPSFVIDYPVELSPLAKKHRNIEGVVERFEGYVAGREICNAFSELNDPIDQKKRFDEQARFKAEGDEEAHQIDNDFIRALEYGMPPTAGLGIGIDRLVMLLTNQTSIRDVIFFPQMKNITK
ncbi:MAG: lysine--tRNA ligase [Ignavibacteriales bacterium CG12_big_fil_rev_8_21_14_0_65_30_8]|nr:MAG: lysine--tRNA ligase [Ignavibacteriales bacterium CG12_big_fil_rev_8_21_14_0_65_30_8]